MILGAIGVLVVLGHASALHAQLTDPHRYVAGYVVVEHEARRSGPGQLGVERLAVAIEERRAPITACGQAVLDRGETLRGRVTLALTVRTDGSVHGVHASSDTTGSRTLAHCIAHVIRGLRLRPGPRGGDATFSVPFEMTVHDILAGGVPSLPPPPALGQASVDAARITHTGAGAFDDQAIARMFLTRRAAFRACYERAIRASPALAPGEMMVTFTLTPAGTITDVTTRAPAFEGVDVGTCVTRVVTGFRFNPGPEGGSVLYTVPLRFERTDAEAPR